jgi:putative Ca2+/H+ antiporter (TMEM165/GDT1 family)
MMESAIFLAFTLVFFAEMGDKTQLMAFSLASRYNHKVVFSAVMWALIIATIVGVGLGSIVFALVPILYIRVFAALLFLLFGLLALVREDEKMHVQKIKNPKKVYNKAFTLTFMAEMGDKTQLAVMALTASLQAPIEVFIGAIIAFAIVTAIGVSLGKFFRKRVKPKTLRVVSGILFLAIGAYILAEALFL